MQGAIGEKVMAAADASLFPHSSRVFYEKAPLVEVICQVRFPPLLAIQASPPTDFQEAIRDAFPLLEEGEGFPAGLELPAEMKRLLSAQSGGAAGYQFFSEDKLEAVTLTRDSLAYSTKRYTLWEEFSKISSSLLNTLAQLYKPSFYNRIGLRYVDAICRGEIGLSESKWSELFKPEILGELNIPLFESNLQSCGRQLSVRLPDDAGSVLLRHGLGNVPNKAEICYLVDFDFFRDQKTEVSDAENLLNHFHESAGRAFRWCITEKLHDALGPRPIGDNGERAKTAAHG
jgi:uncharacterized protein (TIGR04255 family)